MHNQQYPDIGILGSNDRKQEGTKQAGTLNITCDHCGKSFARKLGVWVMESCTGRKSLGSLLNFEKAR
jgi:hypothetical protein